MFKRILSLILIGLITFGPLPASAIKYKGDLEANESLVLPGQGSEPSNPDSGKYKLYFNTDGFPVMRDSSGNETGIMADHRQWAINNNFDIWQRGTTWTDSTGLGGGLITADLWRFDWGTFTGGSMTVSRQDFATNQTAVPDNPDYYIEMDRASVTGFTSRQALGQRIADVRPSDGKTVTTTVWVQSDSASFNIEVAYKQHYGTGCSGGCASDDDTTLETIPVTSTWTKQSFTHTLSALPTTVDKIGIDSFWATRFEWPHTEGATSKLRIAHVQTVFGEKELPWQDEPVDEVLRKCQKYIWSTFPVGTAIGDNKGGTGTIRYKVLVAGTTPRTGMVVFPVEMHCTGGVVYYNPTAGAAGKAYNSNDVSDSGTMVSLEANEKFFVWENPQVAGDGVGEAIFFHAAKECTVGPTV